jgi:hypothetical protein
MLRYAKARIPSGTHIMSTNHQHENIQRRFAAEKEIAIKILQTRGDSTKKLTSVLKLLAGCSDTIVQLLQLPDSGTYAITWKEQDTKADCACVRDSASCFEDSLAYPVTTIDVVFKWKGPRGYKGERYLGFITFQGTDVILKWEKVSAETGVTLATWVKLEPNEASILGALADVIVDRYVISSLAPLLKD